ncbi:MAG: UDP-N-acetylglucosamine 2-epimerase (non-hydrolyzing) [Rhodothermales bacterium]
MKAAVVSEAFAAQGIDEVLVHTGQHYDANMAQIFFDELGIPRPATNLDVRSGTHAAQTGAALIGIEQFLVEHPVDGVVVYGDTNSTLAGALAAVKLGIPVAHIEAGLRSDNRAMPEEINRIATDRISRWLFCPTHHAVTRLKQEGITSGVVFSGDVMLDATRRFAQHAEAQVNIDDVHPVAKGAYMLATIHRPQNTDFPEQLSSIFQGLGELDTPVLMPLHPRTRARLGAIKIPKSVHLIPPLSYLSMLKLVNHAQAVITDSGGLQKEAYWLGVPCITIRQETEWLETLEGGWNQLVAADATAIVQAARHRPTAEQAPFGEAKRPASELIATHLLKEI